MKNGVDIGNIICVIFHLQKSEFTSEQWELIDEVVEKSSERSCEYGRMAYQQGLLDTLNFLKDMLVLEK